ncbi:hypothetical protein BJV78DRAFT_1309372 [Lactifluus subvellereus]|nr:hypothetical protein BJV78DRAFT_1309372 [Lactifluus subvellereus]
MQEWLCTRRHPVHSSIGWETWHNGTLRKSVLHSVVGHVIFDHLLILRITGRLIHPASGRTYHHRGFGFFHVCPSSCHHPTLLTHAFAFANVEALTTHLGVFYSTRRGLQSSLLQNEATLAPDRRCGKQD